MDNFSEVRAEAARILSEKIVDLVVGFKAGTLPLRTQPAFISKTKETKQLIQDGFCQNNLVTLLHDLPKNKKIGIISRGCESRAVRALSIEHQLNRENLYVIGVPCQGILNQKKIRKAVDGPISSAKDDGTYVTLNVRGETLQLSRWQFIDDSCRKCRMIEPVGVDIQIGGAVPLNLPDDLPPTWAEDFAAEAPEARYELFKAETDRCIRCYACREACPMCYCEECFVDHIMPRWSESMVTPGGNQAWHLIRAFHQTGRCVDCGACERACPMDIKMTFMTSRLNADMKEKYGFEVGEDAEKQPPFATITLDDQNRFVP